MKITEIRGRFHVEPQDVEESNRLKKLLVGWQKKKADKFIAAEDNLFNRMILGEPLESVYSPFAGPQYDDLNPQLKDYQKEDVIKMCQLKHVLNANPMGLGKTIETIETLRILKAQSVLIVTPKIIRTQWVSQIKTWWGRDAEIYENQKALDPEKIYIVNYDKLRNDRVLVKFKRFRWDFLVLDEAHKIKSRTSKQTLAIKQIPSVRRIALTGTPILRYVDDLWSILDFFGPEYAGKSYWAFTECFCRIDKSPWGNKIVGTTKDEYRQALLRTVLSMFMIRHEAIEVAYGKNIEIVRLPMTKPQRELYRREKQLLLDKLPENCTIANGAVLSIRLRQTTSWPGLFLEGEAGPKFEWILENCKNNPDEHFVVFTAFEQTATALFNYLGKHDIDSVTITGKNPVLTNQFNKDNFLKSRVQVLIGTIGAMGQGYDGLQKVSRIAIFVDRDWSPSIMDQAEDRLHRMGQEYPVQIYYLECKNSFDQHVGRINENKVNGMREALNNEN